MLRPRTVLRLLLFGFLSWLLSLLVFLALPSPPLDQDGIAYPTSVIRSGEILTRAYRTNEWFWQKYGENFGPITQVTSVNKEWFSLDFAIDPSGPSLVISGQEQIALRQQIVGEQLSDPFVVSGKAGNVDDLLGLHPPWFQEADAMLLSWQVQQDAVLLTLRLRWKNDGSILEIWPDNPSWTANETFGQSPADTKPLFTLLHAKFTSKDYYVFTPHPPLSLSPTRTLHIRSSIMAVLAPTAWLIYATFSIIGFSIGAFVFAFQMLCLALFIAGAVWVKMDRPDMDEFKARIRQKCMDVWGIVRSMWRKSNSAESNREKEQEEGKNFPE